MSQSFHRQKLAYLFRLLDQNSNGFLQLNDFSELSEKLRVKLNIEDGSEQHKKLVQKSVDLFHRFTRDIPTPGYQIIQLDDWCFFFEKYFKGGEHEDILEEYMELLIGFIFDLFDDDRDGYITREGYANIYDVYGIDKAWLDKSFEALDVFKDDRLSRKEITLAVETFLTSDDPAQRGNWVFGNWVMSR
jgi:Ca2+-binding EF-hand superfamily protein